MSGDPVETITPAGTFYFLHDLAGRPITEIASTGGFTRGEIYVHGQHLATYADSTTYFDYSNWLGTTRMIATLAGLEQSACTSWPFGAGLDCTSSPTPVQFTGQVRDASTGLDRFPARYYTSAWGLFTTPDPGGAGASVADPESWDAYAYVRGSPVSLTDPSGMTWCVGGARMEPLKDCISDAAFAKLSKQQQGRYVQVSKDKTVTVMTRMPGPIPLIGASGGGGDPFLALATRINQLNPGGFIRNFEIQAFITAATGPLLGALGEAGELAGGVAEGGGADASITFGHGARHLLGTGLNQAEVEKTIAEAVRADVSRASATGSFWGKVIVRGQEILYKAFTLPDGTVKVGTYFPVK